MDELDDTIDRVMAQGKRDCFNCLECGCIQVKQYIHEPKRGVSIINIITPKYNGTDEVFVVATKSGNIKIYDGSGQWTKPKSKRKYLCSSCVHGFKIRRYFKTYFACRAVKINNKPKAICKHYEER